MSFMLDFNNVGDEGAKAISKLNNLTILDLRIDNL